MKYRFRKLTPTELKKWREEMASRVVIAERQPNGDILVVIGKIK